VSIVANRIGAAGAVSRREIEEALEAEIAFELPDDAAVPAAINRATPVVLADEKSRFARAVTALAMSVFQEAPVATATAHPKRTLLRGRR
jgi:Flp pilus assembly CpaE family ATPase